MDCLPAIIFRLFSERNYPHMRMKPQNAGELFAQADIDGGLIGGAALVAGDFLATCLAAN
jgi:hypothetical protein